MPIQIKDTGSIYEVERGLAAFSTQYKMTSEEFADHGCLDGSVPEFDAIEWNFLLMQKRAMRDESDCVPAKVFSAQCQTRVDAAEVDNVRELIAA